MENKFTPINLTLGSLFVALTAIGANITSIIPGLSVGGVPITLQTFFAVLAGLVLGSKLGAFSMFVYMMLGLVGAPVFAQFKGDRKSTRLNSSHVAISYAVCCLKKTTLPTK